MASIAFDIVGYEDAEGNLDTDEARSNLADYLHGLTEGLDVTFDDVTDVDPTVGLNEALAGVRIEFSGTYFDMLVLVDRYEEDPELRPGRIAEIKNIHD